MNTEACDPAEPAALRETFGARPEGAPPAGWEAVRSFEAEHVSDRRTTNETVDRFPEPGPRVDVDPGVGAGPGAASPSEGDAQTPAFTPCRSH
ncbi:hypothetical protein [Streptomyces litmocidini]|uniref:hypothetical protein n=1 Tax=Streptomyces litmocidini TaxID=67318 RepID=UPI0036F4CC81